MNASNLGRLYMYSRDNEKMALENFTTEALAQAIAADPIPFINALCKVRGSASLVTMANRASTALAKTQVSLGGAGTLDLQVDLLDQQLHRIGEVWIEVKVDAGLGNQQLERYRLAAQDSGRHPRPQVILLAKSRLNYAFPWLSWQSVATAARSSGGGDRWSDLGLFLEENEVANDGALPIEDVEAGSIEPALQMFKKVYETIRIVHEWLYDQFPEHRGRLTWEKRGPAIATAGLLYSAAANFTVRRGLFGQGGPILYGVTTEGGSAYWCVSIGVPRGETAGSLITAAEALSGEWERSTSRPQTLRTLTRVADRREPEVAAEWFEGIFVELQRTELIARLFVTSSHPEAGSDSGDSLIGAPIELAPDPIRT